MEERLCPCEDHDWAKIASETVFGLYGTEPKYSLKNMAPLVRAQSLCCECDCETCVFNPKGICMVPFVTGNAPGLSDDGCADFCYKGD